VYDEYIVFDWLYLIDKKNVCRNLEQSRNERMRMVLNNTRSVVIYIFRSSVQNREDGRGQGYHACHLEQHMVRWVSHTVGLGNAED
jgi:hypothetical protein